MDIAQKSIFDQMLYNDEALKVAFDKQILHAWDAHSSFDWTSSINPLAYLVPLDEAAIFFPGASKEQRVVISQTMGLVIAVCIYEMEESLLRVKNECWTNVGMKTPVSPEFQNLGELFFIEEQKHSSVFRRYVLKFCEDTGIDYEALQEVLPRIQDSKTEAILKWNAVQGGQAFWWIVAQVEQEFLHIFNRIRPFKDHIEPLYFQLHEKHFEEEARHASFPMMMLELLRDRSPSPLSWIFNKVDFGCAMGLQSIWALLSLGKISKVKDHRDKGEFFRILNSCIPLLQNESPVKRMWRVFAEVPYLSTWLNPSCHPKIVNFLKLNEVLMPPAPSINLCELKKY